MKSSKVSIKTRSTPASLSFKGQATKQTTVKWSIDITSGHSEQIILQVNCQITTLICRETRGGVVV